MYNFLSLKWAVQYKWGFQLERQDLAYKGYSTKCCPHFFSTRVQFFQCSTSIESVRWVWSVAQPRAKNKKTMTTRGNAMQYNAIQWRGGRHGQQSNQYWRSCPYHSCCCQIGIICQVFQGSFQYQFWGFLWTLSISNKWCRASTKSTPPSTAVICIRVYMYTRNRGLDGNHYKADILTDLSMMWYLGAAHFCTAVISIWVRRTFGYFCISTATWLLWYAKKREIQ